MALYQLIIVIFFTLFLAMLELSSCHVLKGSVTCLDCDTHFDLSEIRVQVKCSQVKKLAMAITEKDGSFETELPLDTPKSPTPFNCLARILGGPNQMYTSRKDNGGSTIVKAQGNESYTVSKPLNLYTSCPLSQKDGKYCGGFGSSKTIDLPLPKEWGLAPSSYYLYPYIPIIGIP